MDTVPRPSEDWAVTGDAKQLDDWKWFTLAMNQFHTKRELKPPVSCAFLPALYDYLLT